MTGSMPVHGQAPTIASLLGLSPPPRLKMKSILDALAGRARTRITVRKQHDALS